MGSPGALVAEQGATRHGSPCGASPRRGSHGPGVGVDLRVGLCLGLGLQLAVLGLLAACGHADAAPRPAAPPPELLASVAVGPVTTFRSLQAYLDAVSPGAGDALNDRVLRRGIADEIGATSLDGIDPASWMYVLVGQVDGAPRLALLGKVADAKAVTASADSAVVMIKNRWAVIGPKPLVDRVGSYAIAAIASQPVPAAPSAVVYLPNVLARYQTEIEAVHQQMLAGMAAAANLGQMSKIMAGYMDAMFSGLSEIDRVVVTLDASREVASLDLALVPRPGSRIAQFAAAQRPSDYALLDRLPANSSTALAAGRFDAGPYREGLVEMVTTFYGAGLTKDLVNATSALLKASSGEVAVGFRFYPGGGLSGTQLFGLTNPGGADKAITAMLELFKTGQTVDIAPIAATIKASPKTTTYDGVTLRGYETTYDLSKMPAAQRKAAEAFARNSSATIAVFDKLGVIALGSGGVTGVEKAIDAARGKGARLGLSPELAAFFTGSRARKESLAMVIDLAMMLGGIPGAAAAGASPQPFMMAFGFADRSLHMRFAVPSATAVAVMRGAKP